MTYNLGQLVGLSTTVTDANGAPTDATVTVAVTKPDGTTATTAAVTHDGTGIYSSTVTVDMKNTWFVRWDASGAIVDNERSQFDVGDPKPPAYAGVEDLRENLNLTATDRDARLSQVLMSASRAIDKTTGRRFWLDDTASARIFNARDRVVDLPDGQKLLVDDIGTTTGLVVAVGSVGVFTGAVTNYDTGPDNAIARGEPITWLFRYYSAWSVVAAQQIQVTARWGYPSIPDEITEATLLLANRRYKRRSSPEGVLGSAEWGVIRVSRTDPDVMDMIAPYVLPGLG